jgi:hypothetical protein
VGQIPNSPPQVDPIPAGPFVLYPLFLSPVEQTDNLTYSSNNPISATVFDAATGAIAVGILR